MTAPDAIEPLDLRLSESELTARRDRIQSFVRETVEAG